MPSTPPIILHSPPPLSPLPASDPESVYLLSLLQLASPGRFGVQTADWGDNGGDLPYITHLNHHIPVAHLPSLPGFTDPDHSLTTEQKGESVCWKAYIEGQVLDLVNHSLYSLPPNYAQTLAETHATGLSWPESSYIPQRIRAIHRERLDYVGLWGLGGLSEGDAAEEDQKRFEEAYVIGPAGTMAPRAWSGWRSGQEAEIRKRKYGEEEVVRRAKGVFEPLERRIGSGPYFFGDRPTTLDLTLFSHLTLLLAPSLPNPLLPTLLKFSFPALVSHHDRLTALLSLSSIPRLPPLTSARKGILDFIWTEVSFLWGGQPKKAVKREETKKELEFRRARWVWYAGAIGSMVIYLFVSGLVKIELGSDDEGEAVENDEEEMEEVVVIVDEPVGVEEEEI